MTISVVSVPANEITGTVVAVVLNFNGKGRLKKCLDSLLATNYKNLRVVIVDNGSSDGSADFVKAHYPCVKVIEHCKNHGFAKGYNIVMDHVGGDYVALINNDVAVDPNWLSELISVIKRNKGIAAVTPKMLFLENPVIINAAGGSCDMYGVGWNRGNGEADRGNFEKVEQVFYGNGGALLVDRKAWKDIGPFDERYFMYAEDLDWCWRARLKGYKIIYVPTSRVYHQWRGSREPQMTYMLERHWLSTFIKNCEIKTLVSLLPRLIGLKFLKTLWLVQRGKPAEKTAVAKALLWNLINFRVTWTKRSLVQASRKLSDADLRNLMHNKSLELSLWLGILNHPYLNETESSGLFS